jgi:hypothetical protein
VPASLSRLEQAVKRTHNAYHNAERVQFDALAKRTRDDGPATEVATSSPEDNELDEEQ